MIGDTFGPSPSGSSEKATTCYSPQYNRPQQNPNRNARTVFYSATNSRKIFQWREKAKSNFLSDFCPVFVLNCLKSFHTFFTGMFSAQMSTPASRANNNNDAASGSANASRMFVRIRLQTWSCWMQVNGRIWLLPIYLIDFYKIAFFSQFDRISISVFIKIL